MEDKKMGSERTASENISKEKLWDSYSLKEFSFNNLGNYRNVVYSKWLRSLRFGNDYFKLIDDKAYYNVYNKYVEKLLENSTIRVAFLSDVPDVVLGFSVFNNDVLHYIYVHKLNRKQGIAKALLPKNIKVITHLTKLGLDFWNKELRHAIFNPFKE